MYIIDTHAHLDEIANLDDAVSRARRSGVIAIIGVGVDLKSNKRILEIADKYRGFVYPALGLHPGNLGDEEHREATFQQIELNLERAVAVGEIGLDYFYKETRKEGVTRQVQKQVFNRVLSLAKDSGKPALIHSRGSWQDCLDMALALKVERAVFHWYSGPMAVLDKIVASGYFISASPAAEYSLPHREAINKAPVDRLLLETDSPVAYKGVASEPAHVLRTLKAVVDLKNSTEEQVAIATTSSAKSLFGL
ncbi:MAG: yjjV [Dehalococcoidia bacterium]|nr:yjjV [Dehalococcoidia bacterium]